MRAVPFISGLALALLSGCVTVYQPMVGLQRPVAIDTSAANLNGLRLEVTCNRGEYLWEDEAEQLCTRASKLFTNQGAIVRTKVEGAENNEEEEDLLGAPRQKAPKGAVAPLAPDVDLRVDLTAREVRDERNTLMWILSFGTATLVPAMSEYTFAQDVTVRDSHGFLLAGEVWQARFIRYVGVAVWGLNWLLDKTVRNRAEQVTGDAVERDFSRDYYRQLSQLVFNAKMRWALLGDATTLAPTPVPALTSAPGRAVPPAPTLAPDRAPAPATAPGRTPLSAPPATPRPLLTPPPPPPSVPEPGPKGATP